MPSQGLLEGDVERPPGPPISDATLAYGF
uniref:Aryl hydrocarbon receptor nuclear translocator-like protein 1 (Brain and muscle ARNT-like 1) (Member of PAS protein 3) (Basic-helix-loop-helix-PAS protein MOP3) (BHLH-PAS protein JAP3) n=1 Tax=mine drainage metagenome TaxID=410659 RepID=E6Q1T1_9ZZZZ